MYRLLYGSCLSLAAMSFVGNGRACDPSGSKGQRGYGAETDTVDNYASGLYGRDADSDENFQPRFRRPCQNAELVDERRPSYRPTPTFDQRTDARYGATQSQQSRTQYEGRRSNRHRHDRSSRTAVGPQYEVQHYASRDYPDIEHSNKNPFRDRHRQFPASRERMNLAVSPQYDRLDQQDYQPIPRPSLPATTLDHRQQNWRPTYTPPGHYQVPQSDMIYINHRE